jgi:CMP-N,N'-diacetyllegionaminic acid synthase
MKILGIIPARGGSKGVPSKNKKIIAGQPLLQYTLEAASASKKLSVVYVSSDDDEILKIAKGYNFQLHKRQAHLATDESPVTDTVSNILELEKSSIDAIAILQPTSPLRTGSDIDNAIDILEKNQDIQSVISVVPMDDIHPARMYKLNSVNCMEPFVSEYEQARRQEIPLAYYRNGSIYITRLQAFRSNKSMMTKPIKPYIMEFNWLLNIDSPRDVLIAEALIPEWRKHIQP